MSDREAYVRRVLEIAAERPDYRLGGDGSDGTCDCVGLGIGALRRMGIVYDGIHGSNWVARHEAQELWEITSVQQLRVGDNLLKGREPGEGGWDLPGRYGDDPDQTDYYHFGVCVSVDPLRIVHVTTPTAKTDTVLGKWRHAFLWRQLSDVEEERSMETLYQARVVLESSKALNIRAGRGTHARKIGSVPNGALVSVLEENVWPLIEYDGLQGYVCGDYLRAVAAQQETEREGATTRIRREDGVVIELSGLWTCMEDEEAAD